MQRRFAFSWSWLLYFTALAVLSEAAGQESVGQRTTGARCAERDPDSRRGIGNLQRAP